MKKVFLFFMLLVSTLSCAFAADCVKELNDGNSSELIGKAKRTYVIDFTASWCGPCRMFAPIFHKVADEMNGSVDFYQVDVDKNPVLCYKYQVSSVPTIYIYNPVNKKSKLIVGLTDEESFKTSIAAVK